MSLKMDIIGLLSQYEHGKFSNILLNDYFKEKETELPGLTRGEKGFITEVFYGVIRNVMFLDYSIDKRVKSIDKLWVRNLLRLSMYQIHFMDSDDAGVVYEGVEVAKLRGGTFIGSFVNGVLRSFIREKDEDIEKLLEEGREDIVLSYPKWFFDEIKWEHKENYLEILKSYKKIPNISVKINKLNYNEEDFLGLLEIKGIKILKKVEDVYYIDSGMILETSEFKRGQITVQDGSSFLAAKYLDPQPGERILDTCSAPGGKSMAMAEMMGNEGEIVALDIHEHKLKLIESRTKQMGIDIVHPELMDARLVDAEFGAESFDRVLVDAPCSGFGVIRKKPEVLYTKKMKNVQELAKLQLDILNAAAKVVKVGGTLVYSTCTILNKENLENVTRFLKTNPNFEVEKVEISPNVNGSFDKLGGLNIFDEFLDGFYMIKLKKIEK
ncbi:MULTISPECIES: 16S rRNA (cytosine(967)-C(5))-methyltransferase RsmB [Psychrilyobacter]|uniref:16S rRNA (cytosine(967)-C(5))-methyltransferase n=1 Tax=Psychrilyobacter piezotolerans TaxID=2293438 RepID=A0ABX9KK85_9FUSO|nr:MULTISPECIES: 16S rRNA (cytosine(967)-C(5))-methyltransferase RsmB [Psychrilyobacter]MCS5420547.1 16S rRNA (cytosine(967)-C(5))-methyltransferase RsmB [Psychrilyobacter sp. S5]NDI76657.1 16S rRNA (cytosine(967)-C(5))-methyltransferase RsmB [Psychrilyobacter piezotolerans]RDE65282.1 16S rRNA (cytosine(967)-C(5))-methyltransferase RsmB [Psychrilyobacter sp. S5]REI42900.1 16S rRNA (cytosine(967)-C(5))-methyltransferase RsmB [Psychrilyobacter piezotolerans]